MEIEENYVFKTYDQIAKHFSDTRSYKWPWITNFIENNKGKTILDLGCGNGRNMDYDGCDFMGVDTSQEFVNICRKKNFNCIKSDMCSLCFKDNNFDAIICIASFHHLSTEARRITALEEMKRVLRKGGKILLSVWSKEQPKKTRRVFKQYGDNNVEWNKNGEIYNRYYYIFNIDEIKNLFKMIGLSIESHKWDCGNEVFILSRN